MTLRRAQDVAAHDAGDWNQPAALRAPADARRLRVLVARAEPDGSQRVASALDPATYEVLRVASGAAVLAQLERARWDALLLDVELEGASGFEVCRRVRERDTMAVIFVTARGELSDRVRGFDAGADDYVVTPVDPVELDRRVRAVVRRCGAGAAAARSLTGPEGVALDLPSHTATVEGRPLTLTAKEFALLALLLSRRGEVLSADEVSRLVWGYETFGSRNFVEAHISRLRAKLAAAGARQVIDTLRGVGYVVR